MALPALCRLLVMIQINTLVNTDGSLRSVQTVPEVRGMSLDQYSDLEKFGPPRFHAFWGRDYIIEVEGKRVGWILSFDNRTGHDRWVWVLTGFGYGAERICICGECPNIEAAKTEFIEALNNWLTEPDVVRH